MFIHCLNTPFPSLQHLNATAIILSFCCLTLIATGIYRVTLHPLSKYPGPFLAKFFDCYGAYWDYKGVLHLNMWQNHQKYGNIVRYGPNKLLVNSYTGLHDIYDHSKNVKKSQAYRPFLLIVGRWTLLSAIDKYLHRRKRRVINRWFSGDNIKAFEPKMQSLIRIFCAQLQKDDEGTNCNGWTRPKDMKEYCHWLTFDVSGQFFVGQKYNTMRDRKNRFMLDAIHEMNIRLGIYAQSPSLIYLGWDLVWSPITRECRKRCLRWVEAMQASLISQSRNKGTALLSTAVNTSLFSEIYSMPIEEISEEVQLLIAGGSETTATLLAALFFYLTRFPAAYSQLAVEIRERFQTVEAIRSGPDLASCKYLHACIKETLRMSPPAVGSHWREVEPGGQTIDGDFVPAGSEVGTCIYAIHHNEEYYPSSFDFRPERWLPGFFESSEEKKLAAARGGFGPFSVGPRACVGRSLAMAEVSIALARVIWSLDFRRSDGELGLVGEGRLGDGEGRHRVNEYQLVSHITSWSSGPMVEFRKREI